MDWSQKRLPAKKRSYASAGNSSASDDYGSTYGKFQRTSAISEGPLDLSSQSEADNSQLSETTTSDNESQSESEDSSSSEDESVSHPAGMGFNSSALTGANAKLDIDRSYKKSSQNKNILNDGGVAAKLMASMGYTAGTGLGKHGQGRVEPVEESRQKGRRGLGMVPSNFETDKQLDWEEEEVAVKEQIDWIPTNEYTHELPDLDELKSWMVVDEKKLTIEDETNFVDPEILEMVLSSKSIFDSLEDEELRKARTNSNPFELIRGVFFQNRAAMKMANMDAAFGFMFTSPKDASGKSTLKNGELLYFADICAGPGGFTEYVLWRKKWKSKGFGLTLKSGPGVNDFKLSEFFVSPSECFEPHYGKGGVDGDGDIYSQENIDTFTKFVKENSGGLGVHFVMADGGFSVEGQENEQEILSKRLYLCQFLCAISMLRSGGHFLCKLFDVFTPFSVGLIYLFRIIFDQVCIMKPVTSRPANSERYIVCKGYHSDSGEVIRQYLTHVNLTFDSLKFGHSKLHRKCVQHLVPIHHLREDKDFFNYIYKSNCDLGREQCVHLKKIQVYAKNPDLRDSRQYAIRKECLELWQIPDNLRTAPDKGDPNSRVQNLMDGRTLEPLGEAASADFDSVKHAVKSIYDYKCCISGPNAHPTNNASTLHYFLSLGRKLVFKSEGSGSWQRIGDDESCRLLLDIPKDTLFVGEIVNELKGEGKGQRRLAAVHILDILFLYGEDFRNHSYNTRMEFARMFVTAVTKPSQVNLTPIRVKRLHKIEDLPKILSERCNFRLVKGSGSEAKLCYTDEHLGQSVCHVLSGIYFIPFIRKPWTMAFSKSQARNYFYNIESKVSNFESPKDAFSGTNNSMQHKILLNCNISGSQGLNIFITEMCNWICSVAPWLRP